MPNNYEYECGTCWKEFPAGWEARENHCDALGHDRPEFECDTCHRWFNSESACEQHMDATEHWGYDDDSQEEEDDDEEDEEDYDDDSDYECSVCNDLWYTEEDCHDHQVEDHYYCSPCQRFFESYNNIKMHLNSRIHRGANIDCPFCQRSYATATGLTHHLENGSCHKAPFLNRDQIYRIIRAKDPNGRLTNNLLEYRASETYEADHRSWNGNSYECYLCHRCFNTLGGLNMHLNSVAHKQTLYHCPQQNCRHDFNSLAGLLNHLESETCGYIKFENVQRQAQDMIRGGRLLSA